MNFTLTEAQVALRTGLTSQWIRENRGPEGVNWVTGKRGQILWDPEKVQALLDQELAKTGQPRAQEPMLPQTFEVTVRRTDFPNKRVLQAITGDQSIVIVAGVYAPRFHPGQKITVQHHPTNSVLLYVPPLHTSRITGSSPAEGDQNPQGGSTAQSSPGSNHEGTGTPAGADNSTGASAPQGVPEAGVDGVRDPQREAGGDAEGLLGRQ